ncbi:MAG: NADH-quinone oxidoreductase subunit NuoN [Actinomycetaceae bacterium]|nr:NADH-quinone oxidoreductase subunit NuoN [Actinomycetaceae bacterium]
MSPHIVGADLLLISPIIVLLVGSMVGVLVEAFVPVTGRRNVQVVLSMVSIMAALVGWVYTFLHVDPAQPRVLGGGEYLLDGLTIWSQLVILIIGLLAVGMMADAGVDSAFAAQPADIPGSRAEELSLRKGYQRTELFPLALFSLIGLLVFPAAGSFLVLFIALEVISLPLYVLSATARHRRLISQEAAAKYFVLGAFSSAFFLMGGAILFGYSGSLYLGDIARASGHGVGGVTMLSLGVVLVLIGLLFKTGAAPFHAWTPDVYQGAPTPITGYMAAGVKAAAFLALARFFFLIGVPVSWNLAVFLWIVAILTMIVGTFWGIVQEDVKRMLAFSSIAHAGFVLIAIIAKDDHSTSAILFYMLAYGVATVGAFAVIALVRRVSEDGALGGEANQIADWAGLGKTHPWLAAAMMVFLLSFAGIPLTAGFVGKFVVFASGIRGGATVLVVIAVIASAITAYYYFRLARTMYMEAPSGKVEVANTQGIIPTIIAVCALATIALGVLPQFVLQGFDLATIVVAFT